MRVVHQFENGSVFQHEASLLRSPNSLVSREGFKISALPSDPLASVPYASRYLYLGREYDLRDVFFDDLRFVLGQKMPSVFHKLQKNEILRLSFRACSFHHRC